MKIWIDGDACPAKIKEIIFKAAIRTQTEVMIVANHFSKIPASPLIRFVLVGAGFDIADQKIVDELKAGDLVITADIPLAHDVIEKDAHALNPRGQFYTKSNIKQALAMRNFNTSLRDSGLEQKGPAKIADSDIRKFANHLDRFLSH